MLESRPSHSRGTLFGYALIAGIILLDVGLLLLLISQPVTILSFAWGVLLLASVPAVGFIAFWASSLSAARYHVEGEVLVVEWGRIRNVVPLARIKAMVPGASGLKVASFRGLRWPGCYVGYGRSSNETHGFDDLFTLFYATEPPREQLLIVTDTVAFGLSPADQKNFADCLEALLPAERSDEAAAPIPTTEFLHWQFWQDRRAQLLLSIPVLLNGALFAFLCGIFGRLPVTVPLHFDRFGVVDRVTSPSNLFVLPLLGLCAWLLNGALGWIFYRVRTERPVANLLWSSSIVVQITTWIALAGLLT
jgi:hypothetical protein